MKLCSKCGKEFIDESVTCPDCSRKTDSNAPAGSLDGGYNVGVNSTVHQVTSREFAALGFFVPIVGLVLYLVYREKQPLMAKSAGKGALIGIGPQIVILIILATLYFYFVDTLFKNAISTTKDIYNIEGNVSSNHDYLFEDKTDEILEKYADVEIGDFVVEERHAKKKRGYVESEEEYFEKEHYNILETRLDVTVRNKSEKRRSYIITIEAIDETGARLDTDMVMVDRLNNGQEIHLEAFEYVENEKIEELKKAEFRILEIEMYDF